MNKHPFSQIYRYLCSYCNYLVETEGPWPFRREEKARQSYECLYDACSGPIHGLMARVYCSHCDKMKEYPFVQYAEPLRNLSGIWWTDVPRKTRLTCHKCKNLVYLILPPGEVRCLRCKTGTFDLYEPMAREETECFPVAPPNLPLRVRQNGKTIRIPKPFIVIDSQEHMGYKFERFTNWFSGTIRKRLPAGDYTLQGMEDEVIVERKTLART
ncbi:MAG TPA: hypothetical protein VLK23_14455 [Thermodesulfobacteriota bacterium]|nr:hypothetical protein [Thermodesulfobacteriota bacterium]